MRSLWRPPGLQFHPPAFSAINQFNCLFDVPIRNPHVSKLSEQTTWNVPTLVRLLMYRCKLQDPRQGNIAVRPSRALCCWALDSVRALRCAQRWFVAFTFFPCYLAAKPLYKEYIWCATNFTEKGTRVTLCELNFDLPLLTLKPPDVEGDKIKINLFTGETFKRLCQCSVWKEFHSPH